MQTSVGSRRRSATGANEAPVAVAVHSSDPMTALGATSILRADPRLTVLAQSRMELADVIVVIEETVGDKVFGLMRDLRAQSRRESPPRCVVVTDHFRVDGLMMALQCGLFAVLQRCSTSDEELLRTVHAVSQGAACLPPWLQGSLLAQLDRVQRDVLEPNGLTVAGLSARERDVVRLIAEGCSTEEIAGRLAYSERTVKNVLRGLMRRHQLNNRAHAVAFAWRVGVI